MAKVSANIKVASQKFPFEKVAGHIASIKQRTGVAEGVVELRKITGLDFGDGVDGMSRQAWQKWWEHETSCIDNAKDGVRQFVLTGVINANGKPVLGANVLAHAPSRTSPNGQYQLAETLSDSSGRYVLAMGIPPFGAAEESTWKATFTVRNPPRFVPDQEPVVMTLHRQKRVDTDRALVRDTLEKNNDTIFAGVPVEMNFKLRPDPRPPSPADTDANLKTKLPAPQAEAALDRQNARSVVEAYVAAALAGRVEQAASLAKGTPGKRNQIESLPKQLNVQRLVIKSVYVNDPAKPTKALATSEAVKLTEKQPDGQRDGFLVLTLTMSEEDWWVTDIDFESEDGAEDELKRFREANPSAVDVPTRGVQHEDK